MTTQSPGERLLSLDTFRGATIAAMILVNNSGDSSQSYWPLSHQPWHGWTPTDVIFPFFLFMAGMTLTFSQRTGFRPALARSLKLIGLGLLVNYATGGFALVGLRWAGVLQRIGVCILAAWAARRFMGPRGQAVLAALLLIGYWGVMTQVVGPEGFPPSLDTGDEPRRAGRSHRARRSPVPLDQDLGSGRRALDLSRHRDRPPGPPGRGMAALESRAQGESGRSHRRWRS